LCGGAVDAAFFSRELNGRIFREIRVVIYFRDAAPPLESISHCLRFVVVVVHVVVVHVVVVVVVVTILHR
jgi:hypothetical protein